MMFRYRRKPPRNGEAAAVKWWRKTRADKGHSRRLRRLERREE
jgi:hypothetical protein